MSYYYRRDTGVEAVQIIEMENGDPVTSENPKSDWIQKLLDGEGHGIKRLWCEKFADEPNWHIFVSYDKIDWTHHKIELHIGDYLVHYSNSNITTYFEKDWFEAEFVKGAE